MRKAGFLPIVLALTCARSPAPEARTVLLATTTSFQDTGLLDVLVRRFQAAGGPPVKAIAVGTGEALAMGARGDADVLVVHAPKAEEAFMAQGHGRDRKALWHNDFVLVGPKADPAGLRGRTHAVEAFEAISRSGALFVSRGDNSGTHKKEQEILALAGIGAWPKVAATGQGMGETLRIANEKQGYTLTDRGTWLATRSTLSLEVLVETDMRFLNSYHVIEVDPARHPRINAEGAHRFAQFLVAPPTQRFVADFGRDRYGQPLFFPDALPGSSP